MTDKNIFEIVDNFAKYKQVKSHLLLGDEKDCPYPKVSIIMPVYNRPEYFPLSLQSVLDQDYKDQYEIVVVDNNPISSEKTNNQVVIESVGASNIFYYRNEENIGMFGNWNRCIELARAPYVVFCHDDDMLLPTALSTLMYIQKTTKDKAIFGAWNNMDEDGKITRHASSFKTQYKLFKLLKWENPIPITLFDQFLNSTGFGIGCLFSKKCLLEIGGYNEEFFPSADYAMHILYTYKFGSVYTYTPTFNYRIAENESMTVYQQFVPINTKMRADIIPKLPYPRFLLKRINESTCNCTNHFFERTWGKKDPKDLAPLSKWDLKIYDFVRAFQKKRYYRLNLHLFRH